MRKMKYTIKTGLKIDIEENKIGGLLYVRHIEICQKDSYLNECTNGQLKKKNVKEER